MTRDEAVQRIAEALSTVRVLTEERGDQIWARIPDDEPERLARKAVDALGLVEERVTDYFDWKENGDLAVEQVRCVTAWGDMKETPDA